LALEQFTLPTNCAINTMAAQRQLG